MLSSREVVVFEGPSQGLNIHAAEKMIQSERIMGTRTRELLTHRNVGCRHAACRRSTRARGVNDCLDFVEGRCYSWVEGHDSTPSAL